MREHQVDSVKCDGCGKCVDICNLDLWELVQDKGGATLAHTVNGATRACHFCFFCKDICPHNAITICFEEDELKGRIVS